MHGMRDLQGNRGWLDFRCAGDRRSKQQRSGRRPFIAGRGKLSSGSVQIPGVQDVYKRQVSNWNGYFRALLYLTQPETFNLQQVLRNILFVATMPADIVSTVGDSSIQSLQNLLEQLRYAVLIVGMLPMMVVYPFVQKFFVKGMMIGAIKE